MQRNQREASVRRSPHRRLQRHPERGRPLISAAGRQRAALAAPLERLLRGLDQVHQLAYRLVQHASLLRVLQLLQRAHVVPFNIDQEHGTRLHP